MSRSYFISMMKDKDERIIDLEAKVAELEQELQKSTDQNDLILDEFIRVKLITSNTEIHQLCERAHVRMRQNVPVIERNHRMEKRIAELDKKNAELVKLAKEADYLLNEVDEIHKDSPFHKEIKKALRKY